MKNLASWVWGAVGAFTTVIVFGACSSDSSDGSGGAGGSGAFGGFGATGGVGATGGTAGSAGSAGSAGTAATGGTAGTAGSAGGTGTPGDHLLINEVGIEPGGAEFIEIYNPTFNAVDLSDHYLSDNSAYYTLTGGPWNPQGTPGTDFLAKFPAGTTLPPDGVIVVASEPGSGNAGFEQLFGSCPDFTLNDTAAPLSCGGGSVPAMEIPANGGVGDAKGALLSNNREMVVLFKWDGSAATVVDVDYVTWGSDFDNNTRVDKTGVSGYQADTPRAQQKGANQGVAGDGGATLAVVRCGIEDGEKLSGGNGSTGHDETSEDLTTSFTSAASPTPGQKNTCSN